MTLKNKGEVRVAASRKSRGCALCRTMPRYNAQTAAVVKELEEVRAGLDPMFYKDLESFRKAVEDGTVDRDKGCRNMREYRWSVSHAAV